MQVTFYEKGESMHGGVLMLAPPARADAPFLG